MSLNIKKAITSEDLNSTRTLFREYAQALGIDLSFQAFEEELAGLPGKYAPPKGGILLAFDDGKLAGCVAVRPLEKSVCEIKRLFVRSAFKGKGIGEVLMKRAIEEARATGYRLVKLDSLKRLQAAAKLYDRLGFKPTAPYNFNEYEDVYYLEYEL